MTPKEDQQPMTTREESTPALALVATCLKARLLVLMGDSDRAHELASELVRRWNAAEAIGAAE